MAILVLKDASVTVNSVDLSDYVASVTIDYQVEAVPADAMGNTARAFAAGLQNSTVNVTFNQDYATSQVEATIFPLVGTNTTVVVKPTSAAVSATNPSYTIAGFLAASQPVNGAVGELATQAITVTGALTKATA